MPEPRWLARFRDGFALRMGVQFERKEEIYVDLLQSTSLLDIDYWLQILLSAGIATLGLTLNSPAVIIGAMLISPLMGPILAGGLALATGDIILGFRVGLNLLLSCLVAVTFSMLLVGFLPFKEMTNEIAARTQPTTLDLIVALFSGWVGSIAICKQTKGVVTSIPGVAIAVALMPPLGVVGYGLGLAVSLEASRGLHVAWGGALLFLTNLVAITFTAMTIFLALHLDTPQVKARVYAWHEHDPESVWAWRAIERLRISEKVHRIGSLPARVLIILFTLLLISIPLGRSLNQLKQEYARKEQETRMKASATELWRQYFGTLPDGQPRSYIDDFSAREEKGRLTLYLRVFTSRPYTADEKVEWTRLVAAQMGRPIDSIELQLVEIPTASGEIATLTREDRRRETPPSVTQLRTDLLHSFDRALQSLRLPPAAKLLDYDMVARSTAPMRLVVRYLGERDIDSDAEMLIAEDVRIRLADPDASVSLERIPLVLGEITFRRNHEELPATAIRLLDRAAGLLRQHQRLHLEIIGAAHASERENIAQERVQAAVDHFTEKWKIPANRISTKTEASPDRRLMLRFEIPESAP
ncbi:MAG: DUF389 domain-containing protein [Acidobacteria bacterium]|nr:DUF389 domain-containing protein [Acidobacteriota bacterium]